MAERPLGGGCLFDVRAVDLADGRRVVVKAGSAGLSGQLLLEARMLADLAAAGIAVPAVLDVDDTRLVMACVDHDGGGLDARGRVELARQLAALHAQPRAMHGYDYDTVIGALHQPNPQMPSWIAFFREQRLAVQVRAAAGEGVLDPPVHARLDRLMGRLDDFIDEPPHPSLLHGDLWSGNVLAKGGRPVAWIDPAIYCGHPEIELAFALLFGPLDRPSLRTYLSERPLPAGFELTRCVIYQLYPLLVHLRLFGRSYVRAISDRLGSVGL